MQGSEIVDNAENQDTNDLHKCISFIQEQTHTFNHPNVSFTLYFHVCHKRIAEISCNSRSCLLNL
jgi:hypothetical protein